MAEATAFGSGLRRLRAERGLSLAQVARLVHYSKGYLSNVENGRKPVNPVLARRLDEALAAAGKLTELAGAGGPRCPYPGLAAFEAADASRFFGRERATAALLGRLADSRERGLPLVVFGASGAGKSSLLRAGLVPALAKDPLAVTGPVRVLTPAAAGMSLPAEPAGVLVVDQFEEVFTLCADPARRRSFIGALCGAATRGTLVVLGVRADFFGHCLAHPGLLEAVRLNQFTVGAMDRAELVSAITGPAAAAGLSVQPGLVELLLRDLGVAGEAGYDPGALPLLSYALLGTWQQREQETLTVAGYRLTGGIDGAVAAAAERVHEQLGAAARAATRRLLLRLVRIDERDEPSRRRVRRAELVCGDEAATGAAIEALAEARLLVLDRDSVEITHEALLRAWPRLVDWLAADREGLRLHRQLTEAADGWRRLGQDPGALYAGARLAQANQWAAEHEGELTGREREFLRASAAAGQRRTRRQRRLVALLTTLLVLAASATAVAVHSRQAVAEQRDLTAARAAVAAATALRHNDPATAVQLRLAAYQRAPTPELRDAVLAAFAEPFRGRFTGHTSDAVAMAYAPDKPMVATASWDRTARLWDVSDPHHPTQLAVLPLAGEARALAVHPAGRLLATADSNSLRLWEISDPRAPKQLAAMADTATAVAFSPDGRGVATGGADGSTRFWPEGDPKTDPVRLPGHTGPVHSLTFSPDGTSLATTGDSTARLWDLGATPRIRAVITGHTASVRHAAFSPDGRTLATASWDRTARLWRAADAHPLATVQAHQAIVWSVAFSPDGRRLASAGGNTILWDTTDPASPRQVSTLPEGLYAVAFSPDGTTLATPGWVQDLGELPLTGHEDVVTSVTADGTLLATGSWDHTVRLWDTRRPRPLATLTGPTAFVRAVARQPGGPLLAAASEDGALWLWDIRDPATPKALPPLRPGTGELGGATFSPDGRLLAVAGHQAVTLWDTADFREIGRITGFPDAVWQTAFSPGSRQLTTWAHTDPVRRWDIQDPARPAELPRPAGDRPALSGALSPDGELLAVYHEQDRLLRLIGPEGELASLPGTPHLFRLTFSTDGRRLAAGAGEGAVRLWDVRDPRAPVAQAVLTGHSGPVPAVAFTPDGAVVSGGNDRAIRLWDTDFDRVVRRICALAQPRLTREVWQEHFPGLEFQPPC